MSTSPIASVVIPAHNEAVVIRRCLDALLTDFALGELEVLVSCNGCTDGTADIVRSSWKDVRVIEVEKASKAAALRAADEALSVFPRIYLDADVVLPGTSARCIIEHLQTGRAVAARPTISYDVTGADAVVRSYYRARGRLFSRTNSLWAAGGVYAVSAAGRARYDTYPDIIADDLFAAKWFKPSEVEIVGSLPAVITVPRRARDLFRVLRRRYQGNVEIQGLPGAPESTTLSTLRGLMAMAASGPGAAVDTVVFLGVVTVSRITRALFPPVGWARDNSSREAATTSMLSAPAVSNKNSSLVRSHFRDRYRSSRLVRRHRYLTIRTHEASRWKCIKAQLPDLANMNVLNLGDKTVFWERAPVLPQHVAIVNLLDQDDKKFPWLTSITGDACYEDRLVPGKSFDLVFSNSLIEHLAGITHGQLARVVRSLAPRYFDTGPVSISPN